MTSMLHRYDDRDPFQQRLQFAQLNQVASSQAFQTALAENYVGLPIQRRARAEQFKQRRERKTARSHGAPAP
jgi:hypothetical protein